VNVDEAGVSGPGVNVEAGVATDDVSAEPPATVDKACGLSDLTGHPAVSVCPGDPSKFERIRMRFPSEQFDPFFQT
jgi:hypothetical protein